jgi:hypothetical protein
MVFVDERENSTGWGKWGLRLTFNGGKKVWQKQVLFNPEVQ